MRNRGRECIIHTCEECGEQETKCYRFASRLWLCEYCLNLALETL